MFCKTGVLKNFANFTGKHLCWKLILKKVAGAILKNTCLEEHLRMTASQKRNIQICFKFQSHIDVYIVTLNSEIQWVFLILSTFKTAKSNSFKVFLSWHSVSKNSFFAMFLLPCKWRSFLRLRAKLHCFIQLCFVD